MRIALGLLLLAACAADPLVECARRAPQPSDSARTIPAAEAASISQAMTIEEIVAILGSPRRNPCSGIYCPEWDIDDGRVLRVSFSSACGRPDRVAIVASSRAGREAVEVHW